MQKKKKNELLYINKLLRTWLTMKNKMEPGVGGAQL